MLSNNSWISKLAIIVFLISIFAVNWQQDRTEFTFIFFFYSLAFFSYLIILKDKSISFKKILIVALIAQAVSIIFPPNLSIDYYRFLWDGELAWLKINPFDYKPNELNQQSFMKTEYYQELYAGLSDLSKRNYTCYPTINQAYFVAATALSSSVTINTIVLKVLILITELIGGFYLIKLLDVFKLKSNRIWILFLNPLWIIECTGNTHFEGVMLSFLFIALYFIFSNKLKVAGLFFAVAVQIKITPLILLPFFYRFLGFGKATILYVTTITIASLVGFIHLDSNNVYNFIESLTLYFKTFEFNSFILHEYLKYGRMKYGWGMLSKFGPELARHSIAIISILALYGQITDWRKLFKRMTIGFFVYLMLSSTLHPWYILPLLSISIFTNFSFAIIWSFTVFTSYFYYTIGDSSAIFVRSLIYLEYAVVLIFFVYEVIKNKPLLSCIDLKNYLVQTDEVA